MSRRALLSIALLLLTGASPPRQISIDYKQVDGPTNHYFQFCVGSEHAGVMLRDANQQQLAVVRKELGFKYIRFHGLLCDDMNVYHEVKGQPMYDWTKVDQLYDSFLRIGMKPIVELSFMPSDLASGTKTIFWWKGNVTPPKDYRKWGDLVASLVKHLEDRYGPAEVQSWYFEVWNEPNLSGFWTGTQADYFKLYDATAAGMKLIDPACRIGGPATAGGGWVTEMIRHCEENHLPLNFVSTHGYAVKNFLDPDGKTQTQLSSNYNSMYDAVTTASRQIRASAMPTLPLLFTEWNNSYSSRDPVHDDYLSAPFILENVKKCEGLMPCFSYWTYSDLFEEVGPPPAAFYGGFGLLTRDGIRKASYFACKYLAELGDQQLHDTDASSWATRDGNRVAVLFWNLTLPKLTESNQAYFVRKRPPADLVPVQLQITNVPAGTYQLEIHRTGYQSNDAYSAYIDMGRPKSLTAGQLHQLELDSADQPESSQRVDVGPDGLFSQTVTMRENDVVLLLLTKL